MYFSFLLIWLKSAALQMLKKIKNKNKKILKITVITGKVMFSGEIYYY